MAQGGHEDALSVVLRRLVPIPKKPAEPRKWTAGLGSQ
jgi:hypothetical protein